MTYVNASDGVRIHYEQKGRRSGPPVLLIQGLGADKHGWDVQRFALSPWYRTIAFDNRGSGRSDKPHGTYSLDEMAADAIAVLDHAGVETAHVVGASMGGAITQILALEYPERLRSITLACTACRNPPWRRDLLVDWAETARTLGMGALSRSAARWVFGPRSFRRLWPAIGWMGPLALSRPPHSFIAQVEAILAVDESGVERLGTITCPALVLVGNQDILTPRGDSEELAELIPTAELVVISGAAHGFMVEHASTFNRVLLDFLARAERAYQAAAPATVGAAASAAG
jgi:3-oxoadipate enol-lactonase